MLQRDHPGHHQQRADGHVGDVPATPRPAPRRKIASHCSLMPPLQRPEPNRRDDRLGLIGVLTSSGTAPSPHGTGGAQSTSNAYDAWRSARGRVPDAPGTLHRPHSRDDCGVRRMHTARDSDARHASATRREHRRACGRALRPDVPAEPASRSGSCRTSSSPWLRGRDRHRQPRKTMAIGPVTSHCRAAPENVPILGVLTSSQQVHCGAGSGTSPACETGTGGWPRSYKRIR